VDFDEHGIHVADIYDMALLEPGMTLTGPAIVEEPITTLVVTPGKIVSLQDTVSSFKAIVEGEYDHLPEQAFYMQGSIEDVLKKAEEL